MDRDRDRQNNPSPCSVSLSTSRSLCCVSSSLTLLVCMTTSGIWKLTHLGESKNRAESPGVDLVQRGERKGPAAMSKGIWEGLCLPPALLAYHACPQAGRARDGRRFTPVQPRVLRLL